MKTFKETLNKKSISYNAYSSCILILNIVFSCHTNSKRNLKPMSVSFWNLQKLHRIISIRWVSNASGKSSQDPLWETYGCHVFAYCELFIPVTAVLFWSFSGIDVGINNRLNLITNGRVLLLRLLIVCCFYSACEPYSKCLLIHHGTLDQVFIFIFLFLFLTSFLFYSSCCRFIMCGGFHLRSSTFQAVLDVSLFFAFMLIFVFDLVYEFIWCWRKETKFAS